MCMNNQEIEYLCLKLFHIIVTCLRNVYQLKAVSLFTGHFLCIPHAGITMAEV